METVSKSHHDLVFWLRWILANTLGELVGLGAAFAIGFIVISRTGDLTGLLPALFQAGVSILLGAFEGSVVGTAQWTVLKDHLPQIGGSRWIKATAAGGFLAWTLAMVPVTIMSMQPPDVSQAPQPEMAQSTIYLLAMGMGVVAGLVLASVQWLVLREWVDRAWLWLPANAAAWMVGMPLIFVGTSFIQEGAPPIQNIIPVLIAVIAAAIAVGAIHGAVLVWLLRSKTAAAPTRSPVTIH